MISFRNNRKKSTLSFKVIVVCLLLSGSLVSPGFARSYCYITNLDGTVLEDDGDCTGSLIIDNTVTSIGNNAFLNNSALTSVTIGNSVISIGVGAFEGTALTSVTFPNSVTSIGNSAFYNTRLTSVTIPNSVISIGSEAFASDDDNTVSNTALRLVSIGSSVTSIGDSAFRNNTALASVTIPNSVTSIGLNAFRNNTALTSVTIPDSVLVIEDGTFQGANGITNLTIGNGVTSIGARAFNGANKITTLNIPNSVTTIGTSAFSGTTLLTSLTLGNHLTTIGTGAFGGSGITSLVIPDSVIIINDSAFQGLSLESLILGNSVESIGEYAFESSHLISVTFPASLKTLGMEAFSGSDSLFNVNFLGNAPDFDSEPFFNVASGAKANVVYNATGFGANGSTWNGLIVTYGSAPSGDSGSSKAPVTTPTVVKTADVVFNLKNKKYLSKNAMKTKLSKNKSFKRIPADLYKYSIFKESKKTCIMRGNYVMALKKTGSCEIWVTRTTAKGTKYKYWVKINYIN